MLISIFINFLTKPLYFISKKTKGMIINMKSNTANTSFNFKCLNVPFTFSKKYSILLLLSGLFYGIFFNLATFFLSKTIDKLNNSLIIKGLIGSLLIYLLCMGATFLITNLQRYFEKKFKTLSYISFKNNLYQKKYMMNYIYNENTDILDKFNLLKDFDNDIVEYIKSIVFFVTLFFQLVFLFILISMYSLHTAFCILIFTALTLILVIKGGNASYIANKKVQPIEREKSAIEKILTDFSFCEERNLFNYGDFLSQRYNLKSIESRKCTNKALSIWFFKAQYGGIIFILLTLIVTFFLSSSLIKNEISIGLFVSLFSAFIQLSDLMSWNLSDNIDNFIKSLLKVQDYVFLLNLEEETTKISSCSNLIETIDSIQFKNVSFTYPNSTNLVLDNINLEFKKGKKYAIVGENGCGKTTLFKLLIGLYTSYNGQIKYINSKSENISTQAFLNDICVVFQDFSNYFIPIRDFLQLGTNEIITDGDIRNIFSSLCIDINLEALPKGLDTPLGNIFDNGTNISGGQWQKLCLARAILSKKSIIILDEPTAAIDPISELKIMNIFKNLCKEKTIIYITHRLATIKDTDIIYVINNGKVAQKGSHQLLMQEGGLYKKMFDLQKSWYKNVTGGDLLEK